MFADLLNNEVVPAYYFSNNAGSAGRGLRWLGLTALQSLVLLLSDAGLVPSPHQYCARVHPLSAAAASPLPGTFQPLIMDAGLTLSPDKRHRQPTASAQQLVRQMASELSALAYPPRVLARLAIKGNMILSDAATPLLLDGDAFPTLSGARPDPLSAMAAMRFVRNILLARVDILLTFRPDRLSHLSPRSGPLSVAATTKYPVNTIVLDSHGNLEQAATAGTSAAAAPQWPTTYSGVGTPDGSTGLTWQLTPANYSVAFGASAAPATQIIVVTNVSGRQSPSASVLAPGSSTQFRATPGTSRRLAAVRPLIVVFTLPRRPMRLVTGTLVIETSDLSAPSLSVALSATSGNKDTRYWNAPTAILTFGILRVSARPARPKS